MFKYIKHPAYLSNNALDIATTAMIYIDVVGGGTTMSEADAAICKSRSNDKG